MQPHELRDQPRDERAPRREHEQGRAMLVDAGIGRAERAIYIVVASLLVLGAAFVLVGTVTDLVEGSDSRAIADAGVFLLDRVLLLFIIAELLYTLRVVNIGGRILVEPFLFIGLIAIVRKVLVLTAEVQQSGGDMSDFLVQIGALAGLALVLSVSIHLLRRRGPAVISVKAAAARRRSRS
jgi:uncharacterized membrane protein (DUF373 family)